MEQNPKYRDENDNNFDKPILELEMIVNTSIVQYVIYQRSIVLKKFFPTLENDMVARLESLLRIYDATILKIKQKSLKFVVERKNSK